MAAAAAAARSCTGARARVLAARGPLRAAGGPAHTPLPVPQGWGENDRGVSYTFGPDCVADFLQKHDLDLICRAHQARARRRPGGGRCVCTAMLGPPSPPRTLSPPPAPLPHRVPSPPPHTVRPPPPRPPQVVEEGYEFFAKRQLVTIFSAPNYCGEFENAGAMMSVDDTLMCSFQARRHRGG